MLIALGIFAYVVDVEVCAAHREQENVLTTVTGLIDGIFLCFNS